MDEIVRKKIKAWSSLFGFFVLILIFMFIIAPLMERLPLMRSIVKSVEDKGIDAGALYYTEVEQFSVAEINMKNTMDYMPGNSSNR